jgi:hypothetical protein
MLYANEITKGEAEKLKGSFTNRWYVDINARSAKNSIIGFGYYCDRTSNLIELLLNNPLQSSKA